MKERLLLTLRIQKVIRLNEGTSDSFKEEIIRELENDNWFVDVDYEAITEVAE